MTSVFVMLLSCSILGRLCAYPGLDEVISEIKRINELNLLQALENPWFDVPKQNKVKCRVKMLELFTTSLQGLWNLTQNSCNNVKICVPASTYLERSLGNIIQLRELIKDTNCKLRQLKKKKVQLGDFLNTFENFLLVIKRKPLRK